MFCLSSGESELMALVGGACEGIATRDQWSKLCKRSPGTIVLCTDSSAALGFAKRKGASRRTMTSFSGLGTDVHFSGEETGLQWEDYLFELQNAVEWRLVMSRGQDERSQMRAMSLLLNACSGMTNRVLIDDGARWILQGDEQERENRTAGVKALHSMLAATTSGRAKELVKQGLSEWNGEALRRVSVPVDIP